MTAENLTGHFAGLPPPAHSAHVPPSHMAPRHRAGLPSPAHTATRHNGGQTTASQQDNSSTAHHIKQAKS